jgi:Flp pilus assembly protein TadG
LLVLVFGITEFGRAWMTVNVLTTAAREGCRLAVVTAPDVAAVTARVTQVCGSAGITPTGITVTGPDPARSVTVTVNANFQVVTGTILGAFSGTIPLSANASMRHESL